MAVKVLDEIAAVARDIREGKDKDAIAILGEGKPIQIVTAGVKGYVNEEEMASLAGGADQMKLFSSFQEMNKEEAVVEVAQKAGPKSMWLSDVIIR